ncbi:MAG: Acg family FMN-binding oxidoreductase [Ignavibacteria bacterium]
MKNNLIAWEVKEEDFPKHGTVREKLKHFIKYAILAPSGHNTQPWIFSIKEEEIAIDLYADRSRALPVIDPDDRELIISCGAALANLIIAMQYYEYIPQIEYFPDEADNDWLAKIKPIPGYEPDENDRKLFHAIKIRRTNRLPYAEDKIDQFFIEKFKALISEENITLHIIEENNRENMIRIIENADRIQAANKSFCRELAQWIHPNRTNSKDGIPGYAFGMGDLISYGSPFFIGNLNWGEIQAARDRNLVKGSPLIVILESKRDTPLDWVKTGIALEKLLLKAASKNIAASYLNQPLEIPELRQQVRELFQMKGFPQLILRLGYGKEIKPTPRREVEEVITT